MFILPFCGDLGCTASTIAKTEPIGGEVQYEVLHVLDSRIHRVLQYLVQWKGYPL